MNGKRARCPVCRSFEKVDHFIEHIEKWGIVNIHYSPFGETKTFNIIRIIWKKKRSFFHNEKKLKILFVSLLSLNYLKIAKWVWKKKRKFNLELDPYGENYEAIVEALKYRNLEIARWLFNLDSKKDEFYYCFLYNRFLQYYLRTEIWTNLRKKFFHNNLVFGSIGDISSALLKNQDIVKHFEIVFLCLNRKGINIGGKEIHEKFVRKILFFILAEQK